MSKNDHFQSVFAGVIAGAGAGVGAIGVASGGAIGAAGAGVVVAGGVVGGAAAIGIAGIIDGARTDYNSIKPVSFMLGAFTVGGGALALAFNMVVANTESKAGTPVADTSHTLVLDGDCTPERVTYDPATHQTKLSLPPGCAP